MRLFAAFSLLLLTLSSCSSEEGEAVVVEVQTPDPCAVFNPFFDSLSVHGWLNHYQIGELLPTNTYAFGSVDSIEWNGSPLLVTSRVRGNITIVSSISLTFTGQDSTTNRQLLQCIHQKCGFFGEGSSNKTYWHHTTENDSLPALDWMLIDETFEYAEPRASIMISLHGNSFL